MSLKDYFYELPPELIAQDPLEKRDSSRLMVIPKGDEPPKHRVFSDITDYLSEGDCLVINNTRVIPARLYGVKPDTGAGVEVLLLKRISADLWECLVRPGKKLRPGAKVTFGDGLLNAEIQDVVEDGNRLIKFTYEGIFEEILDKLGEMPLPPYITHKLQDRTRYQTVYAKYDGSAAAPTAGLHFTPELLDKVRAMGVNIAEVTLHVGLGTFRPVKEDNVFDHHMHTEHCEVTKETADLINATKASGHKVFCVGTTSVRTVESASKDGVIYSGSFDTDIFIYPGYSFQIPDGIITNFHLPESTLLMLVSAWAGRERILSVYNEAVKERYRFFSFGDAMLLL